MKKGKPIPVIDLFAGPGGLGEGFMSINTGHGKSVFDIKLSIEKEPSAHKTLTWRSFYRQFTKNGHTAPQAYYDALRLSDLKNRENTIENVLDAFPEGEIAKREARQVELGSKLWPPSLVDDIISAQLGAKVQHWVLIGGPPCQAYSLVGRSRVGGISSYDHRVYLYKEYLRIIACHHPSVFVMENVKGLLSAKVNGEKVFECMLRDLQDPSAVFRNIPSPKYRLYSLSAAPEGFDLNGNPVYHGDREYLIESEFYGVPQRRHRVILLGIREDLDVQPEILTKQSNIVPLLKVIQDLPRLRSGLNRRFVKIQKINGKDKRHYTREKDTDENWKELITKFNKEITSWNGFASNYSNCIIRIPRKGIGSEFIQCQTPSLKNPLHEWFADPLLNGAINHQSRSHLTQDLKRYLFASMFTRTIKRIPLMDDFEKHGNRLLPDHKNATSGKFADRFRVQLPNQPATTVTSHISKDGHYFIHYDPSQCRSLTVREAARIQTFPDNYLFRGSRTAQFRQVGNAVPPFLAAQIAGIVLNTLRKVNG